MKTQYAMLRPLRLSSCLVVAALLGTPAASQTHVTPTGTFFPTGAGSEEFHLVETAARATPSGGTVQLAFGSYAETPRLEHSELTLSVPVGGSAVIGKVDGLEETPFSIYSMNTHLFGDGSDGGLCPNCFHNVGEAANGDEGNANRVRAIGTYMRDYLQDYDVICLQEVWDETNRAIISLELAGAWPHRFYGDDIDEFDDCLHSGLWTLSKYPLTDKQQFTYEDEAGADARASKGWVQCTATVNKGGSDVAIGIFNTHTQASPEEWPVRQNQIDQLALWVGAYRAGHPSNPVIVCGDFNIAQMSTDCTASACFEYTFLRVKFDYLRDVHPNVPWWYDSTEFEKYTANQNNPLFQLFDPGEPSQRLDYILYDPGSLGSPFAVTPIDAFVDEYVEVSWSGIEESAALCDDTPFGPSTTLSDHQAIAARFVIYH